MIMCAGLLRPFWDNDNHTFYIVCNILDYIKGFILNVIKNTSNDLYINVKI